MIMEATILVSICLGGFLISFCLMQSLKAESREMDTKRDAAKRRQRKERDEN